MSTMAVHRGLFPSTTVQTAANVVSQSTAREEWCFVIQIQSQILVRIPYCMGYNEDKDEVFAGKCYFSINKKGGMYVKFPQNVSELNPFLCSGFNRTGVMCSQCQEGLGNAIFSYSMQCLPCMSSGLGWTLYVFLATFPTTILFLVVLIFQCRCITSGPMNAYIFVCQLIVSSLNNLPSVANLFIYKSIIFFCFEYLSYHIWYLEPGLLSVSYSSFLCE